MNPKTLKPPRGIAAISLCLVLIVLSVAAAAATRVAALSPGGLELWSQFWHNFSTNLFKPLILFFLVGLAIPILKIQLEFPYQVYQGLVIYLLISIGWHGGEELAVLPTQQLLSACAFMVMGFLINTVIGLASYLALRTLVPNMRRVDAAVVAGFYGSDSAGTFLTCMGTLLAAKIVFAPYMPVMLAIMEIPGCLVALYLVSRLRKNGLDSDGYMPDERQIKSAFISVAVEPGRDPVREEESMALETHSSNTPSRSWKSVAREVFLNPGLFLLFSGIIVGFISRLQGPAVVRDDDTLFIGLFQGILCLFLLEMGMAAAKRMEDLRRVNWRFVAFALVAPNVFACFGLAACRLFNVLLHQSMDVGTYVLFAVLCAAASYIAVPAVQRLAIPEASPTLPLAASLGVTFVYNVTIGIPLYMLLAQQLVR
ncbi:MAG TPA: sodium-dependent bicarbonate transport family permease [Candidatus Obscuribacterales bacterium]